MKCTKCGADIEAGATFCTNCGSALSQVAATPYIPPQNPYNSPYDMPNVPPAQPSVNASNDTAGCLGVFLSVIGAPTIGLLLYLIWRDYKPNAAKTCLIISLVILPFYVLGMILAALEEYYPDFFNELIRAVIPLG